MRFKPIFFLPIKKVRLAQSGMVAVAIVASGIYVPFLLPQAATDKFDSLHVACVSPYSVQ